MCVSAAGDCPASVYLPQVRSWKQSASKGLLPPVWLVGMPVSRGTRSGAINGAGGDAALLVTLSRAEREELARETGAERYVELEELDEDTFGKFRDEIVWYEPLA